MAATAFWTYDPSRIATTPLYQVRAMIGDVIEAQPQLADAEILYAISSRSTTVGAAAECCAALSARYARSVDQAAGNQKLSYSQLSQAYSRQALSFEARAAAAGSGTPYVGGVSIADKVNSLNDEDNVQPAFGVGMFDSDLPLGQLAPVDGAPISGESK